MKKRRMLVAAILAVSMLTACAPGNKTGDSGKDTVIWYNAGDEPQDFDLVMEQINQKLAEDNIELDVKLVDSGSYNDRMNMVIASGETYDLCFTANWSNDFMMNADSGAYLPIDEYLNGENKALKDAIPDFAWVDGVVNGKTYGIPNYQVMYYQPALFTPKALADKYNLDPASIKSIEDAEPYMEQLKQNESDFYVFNPQDYANINLKINGYYEIPGVSSLVTKMGDESLTVYSKFELPEYLEILDKFSEYYKKGYIRGDVLSAGSEGTSEWIYGITAAGVKPGIKKEYMNAYGIEIEPIPLCEPYIEPGFAQNTMTAVSETSENPAAAVKVVEKFNTDKDLFNMFCFGLENTHYTKLTDKTIRLAENSKYPPMSAWRYGNQFNAYYMEGQDEGIWEETDRINRESQLSLLMGFSVDMTNIKTEIANLSAVVEEFKYLETGTEDDHADYNNFIAKLKSAGLDKVKSEIERQIAEFKKAQ